MTGLQLHLLDQLGLPAFHGPMVAADFYLEDGVHLESFRSALAGRPYSVGSAEGLRTLRPGTARGTLYGGCLSILVSLIGTPWEPATENKLLFIEDVGVQALPGRSHALAVAPGRQTRRRARDHFRRNARLQLTRRAPRICSKTRSSPHFNGLDIPIAFGLRSGHVSRQNVTLIFGIEAELPAGEETRLDLLEPAVKS